MKALKLLFVMWVAMALTGCKKSLSDQALEYADEQIECLKSGDQEGLQKSIQETKEWLSTLDKIDQGVALRLINKEVMESGVMQQNPQQGNTAPTPGGGVNNPYTCQFCGGSGHDYAGETCQICGGKGWAKGSATGPSDDGSSSSDVGGGSVDSQCPHCHGSGECQGCHGSGTIEQDYGVGRIACPNCAGKVNGRGNGLCEWCSGSGQR